MKVCKQKIPCYTLLRVTAIFDVSATLAIPSQTERAKQWRYITVPLPSSFPLTTTVSVCTLQCDVKMPQN